MSATAPPPHEELVIADLLTAAERERPDQVYAVFEDGTEWRYREVASETWSLANGLAELGVAQDQKVLVWLPTTREHIVTWFGICSLGATFVPLNTAYRGHLLEHAINLSGGSVIVAHMSLVDRLVASDLPGLSTVVVVGADDVEYAEILSARGDDFTIVRWTDLAAAGGSRPQPARPLRHWDDMALLFTSGTTGPSKAARVSYLHHYVSGNGLYPVEAFGETDRFFLCVNLFHASGTNPVYTALRRGASLAVPAAFSTATFWADIRRMQATCGLIMSSMMSFLWQQEPQEDDADNPLRSALMGPLTPEYEQFAKRFGIENVFTSYSSTELTCPLYSGFNPTVTSSVGRVIDGFELRVVDAFDDEVPLGEVGELVARHRDPWVITTGYFDMTEATANAWRNGWYHTGDGFRTDADGHFYFVDRIKDVIRRRGENISSFEVEVALLSHESIKEAAAIAVPSDRSEDEVMACVVLKDGVDLDLVELVDFLTPLMAYYMVPRYFVVLEELPKTPTHKIQKAQLRSIVSAADAWDREAHGLRLRREKFD